MLTCADRDKMMIGRELTVYGTPSAEPDCSAFNPDFGWYCPTCERAVQNEHVTFQETHDPRCGGCGNPVEPIEPNKGVTVVTTAGRNVT